ncbi:MAG: rod shape-determining protein MreC [Deltaproteobacteria bacterium]|nr:rod shape-determining protein MreC [Deltaproteobacteria bacterium]
MLAFVRRNQVLLTSFLSVLVSLYILSAAARGQLKADPLGSLLWTVMRPLQAGAHLLGIQIKDIHQSYLRLRGVAAENARLKSKIIALETERNLLLEAEATNRRLRELLQFRSDLPSRSLTAAVIGNSASSWFHSLLLNKGSRDGLAKGMAVVSPAGVVGQIVDVTSNTSKVLLVNDSHSGVDVIVQRSRARGIVSGSFDNGPVMKYVKRSDDVQEGDRLLTSGLDGIFPKGLLVGTVSNVRKKSVGLFQFVGVNLAIDSSRIEEVLVVFSPGSTR